MRQLGFFLYLVILLFPARAFSLTLDEGLKLVTENGRDIRISQAQVDAAEAGVTLARAPYLPSIDLYGRETWLQYQPAALFGTKPVFTSQDQFTTYGFKATQLLYDFGKTSSNINSSKYALQAKEMEALHFRNYTAFDFTLAYLDLLESEKLLAVTAEEVKRYEAHRKDTEARYKAGVITRNELLQADVTLSDSLQRLLTAENSRSLKASRINSLIQKPLNDEVRPEEIQSGPSAGMSLEDAWAVAETENPEIKDIDARIRAKEEGVSSIKSEYLPSIYVSGGYEYLENQYMVHQDNWSFIAGVNLNLFAGGASSGKIRMAAGELKALRMTRDKLQDAVRLEVKRAYLDIQSSVRKIEVTKTAVAQAEENLRLQKLRYREGVGTTTEVLDAVTLLTTAETNSWKALYGLKRAEAGLLYAMGRELAKAYGK